ASKPCLRASGRYFVAVKRISSAASRSPRHAPGPASCNRMSRARRPSGLSKPPLAEPVVPAASSVAGEVCSSTVTPPKREVRQGHPNVDADQYTLTPSRPPKGLPCPARRIDDVARASLKTEARARWRLRRKP